MLNKTMKQLDINIDLDNIIKFMLDNGLHGKVKEENNYIFTSENNNYLMTLTLHPNNNDNNMEMSIKNKLSDRQIELVLNIDEKRQIEQNIKTAYHKGKKVGGFSYFCKDRKIQK